MSGAREVTITLSDEAVAFVKAKIATGEYATESDVIEHELESARLEDEARRRWEQEVLGPIHDRMMADPSRAIPAEQVLANLRKDREDRRKAS